MIPLDIFKSWGLNSNARPFGQITVCVKDGVEYLGRVIDFLVTHEIVMMRSFSPLVFSTGPSKEVKRAEENERKGKHGRSISFWRGGNSSDSHVDYRTFPDEPVNIPIQGNLSKNITQLVTRGVYTL